MVPQPVDQIALIGIRKRERVTRHAVRVSQQGRLRKDDPMTSGDRLQPEEMFRFSGRIVTAQNGRMRPEVPVDSIGDVAGRPGQWKVSGDRARFQPRSMAERSNLWHLTAAVYEPLWRRHSTRILTRGRWTLEQECRIVTGMLTPLPERNYMDAGSSAGLYARVIQAAEPDSGVILVDYSRPMLRKAVSKAIPGLRTVYLQCDAAALPIADACLDGAVMGGTLNELAEPERVLLEMARVMKKDATAVVMHLVRDGRPGILSKILKPGGVWIPDENDADSLFHGAGFELLDSRKAGVMRIAQLRRS